MSRYSIPFIFLDTFLTDYLCFSELSCDLRNADFEEIRGLYSSWT